MLSDKVEIRVKRLNNGAGLPLPLQTLCAQHQPEADRRGGVALEHEEDSGHDTLGA